MFRPGATVDEVCDAVERRVAAFVGDGDPALALGRDAEREMRLLYRALRSPKPGGIRVVSGVAWLHWCRAVASPPGLDGDDLDRAVTVFELLSEHPGVDLPPSLRPLLGSGVDLRGGTVQLTRRAVQLCRTVDRAENPMTALQRAAELFELVLTVIGDDDPNRPIVLNNLAAVHDLRYERSLEVADLTAAIAAMRRAAAVAAEAEQVRLLSIAGQRLHARFQRGGAAGDLTEAIEVFEQARGLTAPGDPTSSDLLSELSATYGLRFVVAGSESDLTTAVALSRAAVGAPADEPSARAKHLSNYAVALLARYEHAGALGDLDTAIDLLDTAVDTAPPDDPQRGMYLTNLGSALNLRSDDVDSLDAAIEACTAAVSATGDDSFYKPGRLSNLANALAARWKRDGSPDDLRAATEHSKRALTLAPADHPKRGGYVSNFASLMLNRWQLSKTDDDLEIAVRVGHAALAATPPDFPVRAKVAMQLAHALVSRARSSRLTADLYAAMAACREAARCATASVPDRILAATSWGGLSVLADRESALAGSDREPDVDGYEQAVSLMPLLGWPGTDRASAERRLVRQVGVASDAAAAALAAGRSDRAVMWLEQGRAVLWSRTLETNVDLEGLRSVDPDLMAQLDRVRRELNRLSELTVEAPLVLAADVAERGQPGRIAGARGL